MLKGLNHITLTVSDLDRSLTFYCELLGFKGEVRWARGAYLSCSDIWLCLAVGTPAPATDYSHIAFSIAETDFNALSEKLRTQQIPLWQDNTSDGDSLYFLDPDDHKLEAHVGDLARRLDHLKHSPYDDTTWL